MCQKIALANAVGEVRGVYCLISLDCCKCLPSSYFATQMNVNSKGGRIWPHEIIERKAHPQMLCECCAGGIVFARYLYIRYYIY